MTQVRVTEWGVYSYFTFLAEDIIMFPNMRDKTIELTKILHGTDGTPTIQIVGVLSLPPFQPEAAIYRISSRGEPNPIGRHCTLASPPPMTRPFRESPTESLVLFQVMVQVENPVHLNIQSFTFVTHRKTLLSYANAEHSLVSNNVDKIDWSKWGPHNTRWFEGDEASTRWITMSTGQRYAYLYDAYGGPTCSICLCDFNPYRVRYALAHLRDRGCPHPLSGNTQQIVTWETRIHNTSVFIGDVVTQLPYVRTTTEAKYDYDGILLDEERIIGLHVRPFLDVP